MQEGATPWGLNVLRYEITEITPDKTISEAMDKQAAAERLRRVKVLGAEGDKRTSELESEGAKIKLINESEGLLISVRTNQLVHTTYTQPTHNLHTTYTRTDELSSQRTSLRRHQQT